MILLFKDSFFYVIEKYDKIIRMKTLKNLVNKIKHCQIKEQLVFLLIIAVYLFCTIIYSGIRQENDKIAILGFHNVVSDKVKQEKYPYNMWVDSESAFREKIAYLYEQGYQTWTMKELYEWKCGKREKPQRVVVLTFDDGYEASKTLIAPILKEYGFCGTTFVIGSNTRNPKKASLFLDYDDIKRQDHMKYYSHTYQLHYRKDHRYAIDISTKEQLQNDFKKQQEITDCSYVAYPYGHYNDMIVTVLKENGVKMAFGYHENRKASRYGDIYTIPRFSINAYTTLDTMKAMLDSD